METCRACDARFPLRAVTSWDVSGFGIVPAISVESHDADVSIDWRESLADVLRLARNHAKESVEQTCDK